MVSTLGGLCSSSGWTYCVNFHSASLQPAVLNGYRDQHWGGGEISIIGSCYTYWRSAMA